MDQECNNSSQFTDCNGIGIETRADDLPCSSTHGSVYEDLDGLKFRLITLLPGQESDTIECKLHQVDLVSFEDDRYVSYEALSCRWGDPHSRPRLVLVNGAEIAVTETLWSALLHLRRSVNARSLWLDALCINQDSIKERGKQVSLMPQIYRNASTVISWLGLQGFLSDAMDFLVKLRSKSLQGDPMIPQLVQSGCSDEIIKDYLTSCYRTNSDDRRYMKKIRRMYGPASPGSLTNAADYKIDVFKTDSKRYVHIAAIYGHIKEGWTNRRILESLSEQYLVANTDRNGDGPDTDEVQTVRRYFEGMINAVRDGSWHNLGGVDHTFCLPTEKAVLSYHSGLGEYDGHSKGISILRRRFSLIKRSLRGWVLSPVTR